MDTNNTCRQTEATIDRWQSRVRATIGYMDRLNSHQKEEVLPLFRSLHDMLTEMDRERERLEAIRPVGAGGRFTSGDGLWERLEATLDALARSDLRARVSGAVSWG